MISLCTASSSRPRAQRNGIALVVVLGFLAILTVLALAFASVMRTERMTSRSYYDSIRSRQLAHSALARILTGDLDSLMSSGGNLLPYPPWDAYPPSNGTGTNFLSSGGEKYVPKSLLPAAQKADVLTWIPMYEDDNEANPLVGKYAFMVVNNSGLLDANSVGRLTRQRGVDSREIQAIKLLLPELKNDDTLGLYLRNYGRFETVPELHYLGIAADNPNAFPPPAILPELLYDNTAAEGQHYADNFHVYSRFPQGYTDTNNALRAISVADISAPANQWLTQGVVVNLRTSLRDLARDVDLDATAPIARLDEFIYALWDYCDEGLVPLDAGGDMGRFRRMSSKGVPMLNEIGFRPTVTLTGVDTNGNWLLRVRAYVYLETWFPFLTRAPDNPAFQAYHAAVPTITFRTRGANISSPSQSDGGRPPSPPRAHDPGDFKVFTNCFYTDIVWTPEADPKRCIITIGVNGESAVRVDNNGDDVDRVYGQSGDIRFLGDLSALDPVNPNDEKAFGNNAQSIIANDPRLNWDAGDDNQWRSVGAPTLGADNNPGSYWAAAPPDEYGRMFCRFGPMESAGEIGFLLFDSIRPWSTIRLLGPDPTESARIMDRISVFSGTLRKGLVNINTRQTNVLTTVFYNMPIDQHPKVSNPERVTKDQAMAMAISLTNANWNITGGPTPMVNYSDIAKRWSSLQIGTLLGLDNDKFLRESVVRNSMGLWGTRQNLFTVMLAARVFTDKYKGEDDDRFIAAEQYAIATVWRDPFKTKRSENAKTWSHENFVQFFHWLMMDLEDY